MSKNNVNNLIQRKNAQMRSKNQLIANSLKEANTNNNLKDMLMKQSLSNFNNSNLSLPNWDDLNSFERSIAKGIINFAESIRDNITVVEHLNKVTPEFNTLVRKAIEDCSQFTDKLVEIKNEHSNRSGVIRDEKDLDVYYKVGLSYKDFHEQFMQITLQYAVEITAFRANIDVELGANKDLKTIVEETITDSKNA